MVDLYIDFDGVIKDTIKHMYGEMDKLGIKYKGKYTNSLEVVRFIQNIDWEKMLEETIFINDSKNAIFRIIDTGVYNPYILTHVNSYDEKIIKSIYLNKHIPGVPVITVYKRIAKADFVAPEGAILIDDYKGNLKPWKDKFGIPIHFDEERKENDDYPVISVLDEVIDLTYDYAKKVKRRGIKNGSRKYY